MIPSVTIISPAPLSENPRLVKEVEALSSVATVRVVSGSHGGWGDKFDGAIADALPAEIVRLPFGPRAPFSVRLRQTSVRLLARRNVELRGFACHRSGELACHDLVRDAERAAAATRADLYIAHYVAALPAAARAAAVHGTAYAFDAEDFHLGDLPDALEHALEKKIIRAIEGHYLPDAAYVTAAAPMIAEAYAETYGIPTPTVLLNVFPKMNSPAAPAPRGTAEPGPSLYWFSRTIGPGRGLETALEAITRARSAPHLYLRGTPAKGYADDLQSRAHRAGVADRLHFLPPAPPNELERLGATYDLGYSGETGFSQNNRCALGNKLFSYLMGGVPILASDIPSHRGLAPELGDAMTMFPIGDATALAAALDRLLLDAECLGVARAHAWHLGQERFNWDVEQARLIKTIGEVVR